MVWLYLSAVGERGESFTYPRWEFSAFAAAIEGGRGRRQSSYVSSRRSQILLKSVLGKCNPWNTCCWELMRVRVWLWQYCSVLLGRHSPRTEGNLTACILLCIYTKSNARLTSKLCWWDYWLFLNISQKFTSNFFYPLITHFTYYICV
jgi:hypothetical protein